MAAAQAGKVALYGFAAVGAMQTAVQLLKSLQLRSPGMEARQKTARKF